MADELEFLVQGSEPEPYHVVFRRRGRNLTALCTCKAGMTGIHCKHRLRLLRGDTENLVSDNPDDAQVLTGWLKGTDVEAAIRALSEAEETLEQAKKQVKRAKEKLADALHD